VPSSESLPVRFTPAECVPSTRPGRTAYRGGYTDRVYVATADLDGDGHADFVYSMGSTWPNGARGSALSMAHPALDDLPDRAQRERERPLGLVLASWRPGSFALREEECGR
jgi:hypothetical protein